MSNKPNDKKSTLPPGSENTPSVDEDKLMDFPCDFSLKVMGENINDYPAYVLSVCQKHVDGVTEKCVSTRLSSNSKYIAVTVKLIATSRKQLDELYIELNACKQTKMAL